jgi:hypothetical protein
VKSRWLKFLESLRWGLIAVLDRFSHTCRMNLTMWGLFPDTHDLEDCLRQSCKVPECNKCIETGRLFKEADAK